MSGVYPPSTCKQVKQILKALGFELRPRAGTSHEERLKQKIIGDIR
jgi:hypothetical protein